MANTNPQAILIANTKIRPCADRIGRLYNLAKMLQAESAAEGWLAMFPADSQTISDGSDIDGRTIITNTEVRGFITMMGTFITYMEQSANANRDLALKIAVNPEQV